MSNPANNCLGFLLQVRKMFDNFKAQLEKRIDELDWMDEADKPEAKIKLGQTIMHAGFPDVLSDVRTLEDHFSHVSISVSFTEFKQFRNPQWTQEPKSQQCGFLPVAVELLVRQGAGVEHPAGEPLPPVRAEPGAAQRARVHGVEVRRHQLRLQLQALLLVDPQQVRTFRMLGSPK